MSDEKEFPSDKADKFVVRFPEGMRDRIAASSKASGRSMNAEIVARLQKTFDAKGLSALLYGPQVTGLSHQLELEQQKATALESNLKAAEQNNAANQWISYLLAINIRMAIERLPAEVRASDPVYDMVYGIASAMIHKDLPSMADGMAQFFAAIGNQGDAAALESMAQEFREVGPDEFARRTAELGAKREPPRKKAIEFAGLHPKKAGDKKKA